MRCILHFFVGFTLMAFLNQAKAEQEDFFDLTLEELMNIEVTSASKKAQQLSDTAAAIFVISQEDIKRSGATSVPDALRMAPGIEVGRIDANKWAVSARGFNGRFANKLLVLIDGRSIYTQAFSGVYWENQDVMLEDIDRIEVIRGPGAALWGANAVNGVINIITKHSSETKGGIVTAGGGNKELGFGSIRYGGEIGKDTTARVYFKGFNRDQFQLKNGQDAQDNWNNVQGGFRIDSTLNPKDSLTLSGDAYTSEINQSLIFASTSTPSLFQDIHDTTETTGGNLRGRLEHFFSPTSSYALQLYYDIYDRKEIFNNETRQTFDIEFQHDFELNDWNSIAWGLSYRYMDSLSKLPLPIFSVGRINPIDNYFSTFVKDEITLMANELWLTIGSKFEHNDYTGFEAQPTLRLLWAPNNQNRFWGAVSRAVRTPSVIDDTLRLTSQFIPPNNPLNPTPFPTAIVVSGSSSFQAEELLAYELGHRLTLAKTLSVDTTLFYNDYQSLRSVAPGLRTFDGIQINQPLVINNNSSGHTMGFETAVAWQMLDWWRWDATYSYLDTDLKSNQFYQEGISPQHKTSVRSVMTPWQNVNLDVWLRYVGDSSFFTVTNPNFKIDSYVTMDVRLAWKPRKNIELSLTGQNLLDDNHQEAIGEAYVKPTEIPRSFYGKVAWEF